MTANVTGQEIKNLLDSDKTELEKITEITDYLIVFPGEFWPAVSRRTLGKKRSHQLYEISRTMKKSEDERIFTAGSYMFRVLDERYKSIARQELAAGKAVQEWLDKAQKAVEAGDKKAAAEALRMIDKIQTLQVEFLNELVGNE